MGVYVEGLIREHLREKHRMSDGFIAAIADPVHYHLADHAENDPHLDHVHDCPYCSTGQCDPPINHQERCPKAPRPMRSVPA